MTRNLLVGLTFVWACLSCGHSYAWSIKSSNKTHVQICAVNEERRPVEGLEVQVRLNYGRGRLRNFITDKDGMISFKDDIGDCAKCRFSLDEKLYYRSHVTFWPKQSGTVVTGVVKRAASPSRMVNTSFRWAMSNVVERVGVDLLKGDLMPPHGKGRHADLYLASRGWKDETVEEDHEYRKYYAEYWFERGECQSEFSIVEKDIGCELPTPVVAPETMNNDSDIKFRIDYRPNRQDSEHIGENRYVLFKAVRPNGVFYGVIFGGVFRWFFDGCDGELMYAINPNPGNRGIVWTTCTERKDDWLKYMRKMYAEEDAEKERAAKEAGNPRKKAAPEEIARNRRMMEARAYSGKWECKAWGLKSVSLSFDKCGLGRFEAVAENIIFSRYETSGWFHWTANDKGAITARAVDSSDCASQGMHELRLNYDFERNVMVPDLKCDLLAGRVSPRADNLRCEMMYAGDVDLIAAARDYCSGNWWRGHDVAEEDALIKAAPKSQVSSLDALCALAKERCVGTAGLVVRSDGAPEIKIGTDDRSIWADIMFKRERGGNAVAPKFECLSGQYGPEIAENAGPEEFLDPFELDKRVKSLGGETGRAFVKEEGAWTYERRRYVKVFVAPGKWDKCKEVLKPIMDKWYTFPVEVREVDFANRK